MADGPTPEPITPAPAEGGVTSVPPVATESPAADPLTQSTTETNIDPNLNPTPAVEDSSDSAAPAGTLPELRIGFPADPTAGGSIPDLGSNTPAATEGVDSVAATTEEHLDVSATPAEEPKEEAVEPQAADTDLGQEHSSGTEGVIQSAADSGLAPSEVNTTPEAATEPTVTPEVTTPESTDQAGAVGAQEEGDGVKPVSPEPEVDPVVPEAQAEPEPEVPVAAVTPDSVVTPDPVTPGPVAAETPAFTPDPLTTPEPAVESTLGQTSAGSAVVGSTSSNVSAGGASNKSLAGTIGDFGKKFWPFGRGNSAGQPSVNNSSSSGVISNSTPEEKAA